MFFFVLHFAAPYTINAWIIIWSYSASLSKLDTPLKKLASLIGFSSYARTHLF
jgi:hypothetical protein